MAKVKLGIERLLETPPGWLQEKRIGILVNQASVDSRLRHSADLLVDYCAEHVTALFGPQHGIRGEKQDNMVESEDFIHPRFHVPVFSLYGATRVPTREMLGEIDILIIDLPDVGTRVYTFLSTMAYCLQAAKQYGKKVVVLDRPNPIGGVKVEGNLLKEECRSFVGVYPLPMRHGLTLGELALLFNGHYGLHHGIGCDLDVIPMEGWKRSMMMDDTGLIWVPPSPNMPVLETAMVYPGQVILEGTNLSEGRGTTRPFEVFGAPFIDPHRLKERVDSRKLPGITLREVFFQPTFHKWHNEVCGGFQIHVTDPRAYRPYITTLAVIQDVLALYPDHFAWRLPPYEYEKEKMPVDMITGDKSVREWIGKQQEITDLEKSWQEELRDFEEMTQPFLLYSSILRRL